MSGGWTRRALLRAAGGAALIPGLIPGLVPGPATNRAEAAVATTEPGAAEFAALRARWRSLLLGTGFDRAAEPYRSRLAALGKAATSHRRTMAPAKGSLWPHLRYAARNETQHKNQHESPNVLSTHLYDSFARLRLMAEAYAQPGTGVAGSARLADAVLTGLDHLMADVYHPGTATYGNGWHWRVGAPQAAMDACVLLSGRLAEATAGTCLAAVDAFVPESVVSHSESGGTGAGQVDLCRVLALRGVLGGEETRLDLAGHALAPVLAPVASGDGFHADGSFLQHGCVPYAGGYGAALLDSLAMVWALLRGSPWDPDGPALRSFLGVVEQGVAPFVYNGLLMDNVAGRGISRGGPPARQDGYTRAHGLLSSIVLLGQVAGGEQEERWRAMVKGWLERGRQRPVRSNATLSVARTARLLATAAAKGPAAPEPVGHRLFTGMDRATHRRPRWAASVSMASERVAHYEYGNGENARGWHTGAGRLSWWGDGHEPDGFWATVDPYRLPGTTVSTRRLADGEGGEWGLPRPDAAWVGGATDGEYAAVGQHLRGLSSTLSARKAWFFLDDCVVCLGAGIACADGVPVETVVDNRNLGTKGAPAVKVDDAAVKPGRRTRRPDVSWAHVAGHAGYVFLRPTDLHLMAEERTGAWRDVNAGGSAERLTRRYLTLWLDHGRDPDDASYAYVLMPGASAEATRARAAGRRRVEVLANTAIAQAIGARELGVTAVNFWAAGRVDPPGIEVSGPACVLIRERAGGTAVICVSDPPRQAASLSVVWERPVAAVLSAPPSVTAVPVGSGLHLEFGDLRGAAGATQRVTVALA